MIIADSNVPINVGARVKFRGERLSVLSLCHYHIIRIIYRRHYISYILYKFIFSSLFSFLDIPVLQVEHTHRHTYTSIAPRLECT